MLLLFAACSNEDETNARPQVGDFSCTKFECSAEEDGGFKVITGEIKILSLFFDSINLVESDESFAGDWIYRITFDWNKISVNGNEVIKHSVLEK